jgi:quinol monooxygenase YgiN
MIFIVVKFTVRPEHSEGWIDRVSDFTRCTRQEPGNLWFEWSRSIENPDTFVLLEAFQDADAGVEHVNSEHFKSATELLPALLAKTPELVNFVVPGAGWSEMSEVSVPRGNTG